MKKNNQYKFASVDVGGTNVRFALLEDHKIVFKTRFKTNPKEYHKTLDKIINLIIEHKVNALALCIPGPSDYKKGIILESPNLQGWNGKNIKKYILSKCKLEKIIFENDANVMALANHYHFKPKGGGVTQFFTISTGFGAGLIISNKIFNGSKGYAQEIATMPISVNEAKQGFHLNPFASELFVSGTGLNLRSRLEGYDLSAKEILDIYHQKELGKEINNSQINLNVNDKIVKQTIDALARTISITLAMLNPDLVVFGGPIAQSHYWLIEKAIAKAKTWTVSTQWNSVQFQKDPYGDDSALIGLNYLIESKLK